MKLPYEKISEEQDRSFTDKLLSLLISDTISLEEREEVVDTLKDLDDPRIWDKLKNIILDKSNSNIIRENAIDILSNSLFYPEREEVLALWNDSDFLIRKFALLLMDRNEREIVLKVAYDQSHEFNKDAIKLICYSYQLRSDDEELIINLLKHEDSEIRELALYYIYWEEPVYADPYLIEATYDKSIEVVIEACKALQFYLSIKSIKRLAELKLSDNNEIAEIAEQAYEDIRGQFLSFLNTENKKVVQHLKKWLEPVWNVLDYTKEELAQNEEKNYKNNIKNSPEIDKETIFNYLSELNTPTSKINDLFYRYDWTSIPIKDRAAIIELIKAHPDPEVRSKFCSKLVQWKDQDTLIDLVKDKNIIVQRSAIYNLGITTPTSDKIAELAWNHLKNKNVTGFYERETLDTYINHSSNKNEVFEKLFVIANNPENSIDARYKSIEKLIEFKCVDKLKKLMWILKEKPKDTWSLHCFLLEVAEKFNIEVDISHLLEIDNLYIQKDIAPLI